MTDALRPLKRPCGKGGAQHVYHSDFGGSFTRKSVLPAMVPELRHDNLAIDTLTGSGSSIQHVSHYTMRVLHDFWGLEVRLTDERLEHILERPEMMGSEPAIEDALAYPERVLESLFDSEIRLYYRFYRGTVVGDKHLCEVVKLSEGDAFVLTAYLTDSVKRGWRLWPETE